MDKNEFSFTIWTTTLKKKIEENGLDTVFCAPNTAWTTEVCISADWGKTSAELVTPWVSELQGFLPDVLKRKGGSKTRPFSI